MDSFFTTHFLSWMKGKEVYLVSGSDVKKIMHQLPTSVLSRCNGAFCSMGNEFYDNKRDERVYSNKWNCPAALLNSLNGFVLNTDYDTRTGNHIEHRPGMINFSVVGRNASSSERRRYFEWDSDNKERKSICSFLKDKFAGLEVSIGGQISIDINPKGNNKSQASKWIREKGTKPEIIFFGDKCHEGGNDYEICLDIQQNKDGVFWQVEGPEETIKILTEEY